MRRYRMYNMRVYEHTHEHAHSREYIYIYIFQVRSRTGKLNFNILTVYYSVFYMREHAYMQEFRWHSRYA